jgi:hypothetical protein
MRDDHDEWWMSFYCRHKYSVFHRYISLSELNEETCYLHNAQIKWNILRFLLLCIKRQHKNIMAFNWQNNIAYSIAKHCQIIMAQFNDSIPTLLTIDDSCQFLNYWYLCIDCVFPINFGLSIKIMKKRKRSLLLRWHRCNSTSPLHHPIHPIRTYKTPVPHMWNCFGFFYRSYRKLVNWYRR